MPIDEIHYPPPQQPDLDIFGGAGSYCVLGARVLSPPPLSQRISWIVDQGSDFPASIDSTIRSWNISARFRVHTARLSTRGYNAYDAQGYRSFEYLTPKLDVELNDLAPIQLCTKTLHLVNAPLKCIQFVQKFQSKRKRADPSLPRPIVVWEPVGASCIPTELLNLTNALPYVDICSPNHIELAALMGDPDAGADNETGEVNREAVMRACEQLLSGMPLYSYTLVVRCGPAGCYIARNGGSLRSTKAAQEPKKSRRAPTMRGGLTADTDMEALFAGLMTTADGEIERDEIEIDPGMEMWLPAFHDGPDAQCHVVDPTGAGNAFLGAMSVALARGDDVVAAAAAASVAASFAVEQLGMPVLGADELGQETWNGVRIQDRLDAFRARCGLSRRP